MKMSSSNLGLVKTGWRAARQLLADWTATPVTHIAAIAATLGAQYRASTVPCLGAPVPPPKSPELARKHRTPLRFYRLIVMALAPPGTAFSASSAELSVGSEVVSPPQTGAPGDAA
jgi:hypothetical protein